MAHTGSTRNATDPFKTQTFVVHASKTDTEEKTLLNSC